MKEIFFNLVLKKICREDGFFVVSSIEKSSIKTSWLAGEIAFYSPSAAQHSGTKTFPQNETMLYDGMPLLTGNDEMLPQKETMLTGDDEMLFF